MRLRQLCAALAITTASCGARTTGAATLDRTAARPGATPAVTAASPLAGATDPWANDPALFEVDLPFRAGVTFRPCDASYSVVGYERLAHTYEYEGERLVAIDATVGEMAGEGHVFCLPNPPLVRHQELDPLRLTLVYDDEGRLESETVALADTGAGDDGGLASSSFVRDAAGTLRSVEHLQEDPEDVVWEGERIVGRDTAIGGVRFTYDDAGRLIRRSASAGETTLATAYVYGDGRLTRVTRELFEDSEAPVRTTTARFEYDPNGRLTACTLDGGDDPLRVVYEYDGAGRLTGRSVIDPDTQTAAWDWQYRYDCSQPRPDDDDEP